MKTSKSKQTLILLVLCIATYLTIYLPEETFLNLSKEDGVFEYLTAILFFLTAVAFVLLFKSKKNFKSTLDLDPYNTRSRRYVFLVFAFIFLFGAGEEISWGQRIFQFETPEKLHALNVQEEFNIHNLEIFNIKSKEGVRKTGLAKLFTMKQIFLGSFLLYLLAVPLLAQTSTFFKGLFDRFYIPIPPINLGVLFILNFLLYRLIRSMRPWDLQWGLTEIQEFNFSLLLLFLPLFWLSLDFSPKAHVSLSEESFNTQGAMERNKVIH